MKEILKKLEEFFYTELERLLHEYVYFHFSYTIGANLKSKVYLKDVSFELDIVFGKALVSVRKLFLLENKQIDEETMRGIVKEIVEYSKNPDLLKNRYYDYVAKYKYQYKFDSFVQFLFFVAIDLYFISRYNEIMDDLEGMFMKAVLPQYEISLEGAKRLSKLFFKGKVTIPELEKWLIYFDIDDTIKYLNKGYSLPEALEEEEISLNEESEE